MDRLRGKVGTIVELGITSDGMFVRPVVLKRQELAPRSVEFGMLWETPMPMSTMERQKTDIGYIQILNFQKATPQELDNAILFLKDGGLKGLILDLRGNAGGSFEAAVDCARRFLSSGVIVTTKDSQAKLTRHMVKSGSMIVPLTVPMVVLVDGDTASAAEILAGALKDNGKAKLVGQTTFGKGCSQRLLQLTAVKGGAVVGAIRVTVAKFLSPKGEAYSGRGISPDVFAERHLDPDGMDDHQLEEAKVLVQELIPRPMNPMGIMTPDS